MPRQIVVDIIGDSTKFTKATSDVVKATVTMESRLDRVKKSLMTGFGAGIGISAVDLAQRGLTMVVDYMQDATKAASDQAEAQSKVNVVFGQQSRVITQWASTAARAMGMSKTAALDAAGSLGNLFDGLGLTEDATVSMSKKIVQLAADLGSFNNVSTDEALTALRSGLLGEAEPMRRFGVALNETAVQAKAAEMGLVEMVRSGGKLKPYISDAAKIQARYALILEGTANAQGDFARTQDGMANSQKTLDAAMEDLSAEVGKFLVGPATDLVRFFTMLAVGSRTSGGAIQEFLNEQRKLRGEITQGNDPLKAFTTLLAAYTQATDDTKVITAEAAQEFMWLGRMAGQTAQDIMDLWKFYREGGKSVEETTRLVKDFLQSVVLTGETTTAVTPLLSAGWAESLGIVRQQIVRTGGSLWDGLVIPTKEAIAASLRTLDDAKGPWKEAWKDLARWAKDPFRPQNFANYLDRYSKRAAARARDAADEGKPKVAAAWRRLAKAAKNPVVRAMVAVGTSVETAINTVALIKEIANRIGSIDFFPLGDKGGVGGVEARASGGPVRAGNTYLVGERGPELLTMGGNGHVTPNHAMGGGNAYTINVNVAPGGDLVQTGRQIVEAIRQYERRSGAVWRS